MYDYYVWFDSDKKVLHREFDILLKYDIIYSEILFGFQNISMSLMQFSDTQVTPTYSKCTQ